LRPACLIVLGLMLAAHAPRPGLAQGDPPDLDRLLKLPDSMEYSSDEKAGATRSEWRQRFYDAHAGVASAEKALEKAQSELKETVGAKSEWQLAPPGMPADASSEDSSSAFQLRQEVKRRRGEVDRTRARLRELEVEANLAGVPQEWRSPSTPAASSHATDDDSGTGGATSP
jgi:hypothetical protein